MLKYIWLPLVSLVAIIIGGLGFIIFFAGFVAITSSRISNTIILFGGGALMMALAVWIYRQRNRHNK